MNAPLFNLHDVFVFVTVVQCLFLALFQVFMPGKNRLSKKILAVFFIDMAAASFSILLFWSEYIERPPLISDYLLPHFLVASNLLKGPLLFIYIESLTTESFALDRGKLFHLIPFGFCFALVVIFHIGSEHLRFNSEVMTHQIDRVSNLLWDIMKFLPPAYALAATYKLLRYQVYLSQQYSNFSSTEPNWLKILTIGFAINWSWSAMVHISSIYIPIQISGSLGIFDNYITLIMVTVAFITNMLYSDRLLKAKFENIRVVKVKETDAPTIEKIVNAMELDKIYLDHRLNIETFAEKIGVPYRDVSAIINREFNTNFFEYVNLYRIDEAKRLLSDPNRADATILDILFESGFNSRSSFHRFWKRIVGVSPSEFRKRETNKIGN